MGSETQRLDYYGKIASKRLGLVAGQLETTRDCFQQCDMCYSWREALAVDKSEERECSLERGKHLLAELRSIPTFEWLTLTGGDPQKWTHLSAFLKAYLDNPCQYQLSLNTALTQDLSAEESSLFLQTLGSLRISIEALSTQLYQKIRGDDTDPGAVFQRMVDLGHPNTLTLSAVRTDNIYELRKLLRFFFETGGLNDTMRERSGGSIQRCLFMPQILSEGDLRDKEDFVERYDELADESTIRYGDLVSFAESSTATKKKMEESSEMPCFVGNLSFHIKPNGDYYPCCLLGGEAMTTQTDYCLGNIDDHDLRVLWQGNDLDAQRMYREGTPCLRLCQWKQYHLNHAGWNASRTTLRIP